MVERGSSAVSGKVQVLASKGKRREREREREREGKGEERRDMELGGRVSGWWLEGSFIGANQRYQGNETARKVEGVEGEKQEGRKILSNVHKSIL